MVRVRKLGAGCSLRARLSTHFPHSSVPMRPYLLLAQSHLAREVLSHSPPVTCNRMEAAMGTRFRGLELGSMVELGLRPGCVRVASGLRPGCVRVESESSPSRVGIEDEGGAIRELVELGPKTGRARLTWTVIGGDVVVPRAGWRGWRAG